MPVTSENGVITLSSSDGASTIEFSAFEPGPHGLSFTVAVQSRGFSGSMYYALELPEYAGFMRELETMDETLRGSALMQLHMEESLLKFEMGRLGQVVITGCMVHYEEPVHRLEFGIVSDQTFLRPFIKAFRKAGPRLP